MTKYTHLDKRKKVLVTGAAGFIGYHRVAILLDQDMVVIGFDNLNDYYEVGLKQNRLNILMRNDKFIFFKGDLADKAAMDLVFLEHNPSIVINLAAQAGVRYSIKNPQAYIDSNIVGFFNII